MKTCTKCKVKKAVSEFFRQTSKKSGLKSSCKSCDSAYTKTVKRNESLEQRVVRNRINAKKARLRRLLDPSAARAANREWRKTRTPEQRARYLKAQYLRALMRVYGLTEEEVAEMIIQQDNRCAVCYCLFGVGRTFAPRIDHCHNTGVVRGLLCNGCNLGLGGLKDSPILLRAAAEYIEKHKPK